MINELFNSNSRPFGKGEELYINALIQFLDIFSQEHIGASQINYAKVFQYISSGSFHWFIGPEIETIDDAMKIIEDAVLDGAPIWNLLYFENEKQQSLFHESELDYIEKCKQREEAERLQDLKLYKCLTCKNYEISLRDGSIVKQLLPGMNLATKRCSFLEGREDPPRFDLDNDDRPSNRKNRYNIDYHPGSFNVYKDKNKNGCPAYEYEKERDI